MFANHDPKPLSAAVAQKLTDGGYAQYIRKHPIAKWTRRVLRLSRNGLRARQTV